MEFHYVYRISRFLHPVEPKVLSAHLNGETPLGYIDFLTELGNGTVGHGLKILTPAAANECWLDYNVADYFTEMSGGWSGGLFARGKTKVSGTVFIHFGASLRAKRAFQAELTHHLFRPGSVAERATSLNRPAYAG